MAQVVQDDRTVKIGDYVLTGKIGQGGIAEIYKGRQESLNRDVAIKVLSGKLINDPDIVRRFERESLVIAKLSHPNIVHIIDRGKAGGRYYFVMEYVDGASFREVIDSQKIPLNVKLDVVVQVCKALDYAHKNGVVHRDIKPTNVLIDRQGNARVADFGIAQIVGMPDTEVTSGDVIMGTMAYMSPEQKISSTNVDQTTDLYSLGIIIYEILTGRKPQGRFKLPSEINSSLPSAFDTIIQKCLAQEPKDRYQTAVELKDALLEIMGGARSGLPNDDTSVSGADSFIGNCRYLDTIKESKFGSTILVENKANKKLYILKKHSRGEQGRKEAKLLKSLKHVNINPVFGAGGDNKSTVIICEYAPGGSLADRMVRVYPWRKAMEVVVQIARGLDFAHKNNIIHGDVRPSNVLFDTADVVKLTDFGMPAHYNGTGKRNWYMAPERKVSKAADIYAVGVILHQLLLGRTPEYDPRDNLNLGEAQRMLPEGVTSILERLLAVRVGNRYQSCEQVLIDWEEFLRAIDEREHSPIEEPEEAARRRVPIWVLAVGGISILVITLLILYLSGVIGH
ncbi:MAG: serine/threonine-protein kinase [Candidatus Zixiibacteriota bacterium]